MKCSILKAISLALFAVTLVGCGQSGPLYLKAQAPKNTTKANVPAHPNQVTTHPTRATPGVTSTTNQAGGNVSQPTVISQQAVA